MWWWVKKLVGVIFSVSSALGVLGLPADAPTWYRCVRRGGTNCPESVKAALPTQVDTSLVINLALLAVGILLLIPNSWWRGLARRFGQPGTQRIAVLPSTGDFVTFDGVLWKRDASGVVISEGPFCPKDRTTLFFAEPLGGERRPAKDADRVGVLGGELYCIHCEGRYRLGAREAVEVRTVGGSRREAARHFSPFVAARPAQIATSEKAPAEPETRTSEQRGFSPFDYLGFCWEVAGDFFEIYRTVDAPSLSTLNHIILGPFCPNCGQPLTVESRGSWMADYLTSYAIQNPCDRCEREGPPKLGDFSYEQIKLAVYKEARRLTRRGELFPVGKCGSSTSHGSQETTASAQVSEKDVRRMLLNRFIEEADELSLWVRSGDPRSEAAVENFAQRALSALQQARPYDTGEFRGCREKDNLCERVLCYKERLTKTKWNI